MRFSQFDQSCMQQALALAEKGLYTTRPNPAVGCVIAQNETVLAEGCHVYAGEAHAERVALSKINDAAEGATAYVTLEPCSHTNKTGPCADALIEAGIKRVVVAMTDPNPKVNGQGVERLKAAGIQVDVGLMSEEAEALNQGFCYSMREGKPYVRVKLAMSLDGKTALSNGKSKWITSKESREDVQYLRARSGAIITGSGTLKADQPKLSVRQDEWADPWPHFIPQPEVVVASRSGSDLATLLQQLHESEVHDVLVEAGPTLAGAFIEQGLVNELWIYIAPSLLGPGANPLVHIPDITELSQCTSLSLKDVGVIGQDVRLIYGLITV